jgi:hypothetical protein
MEHIEPLFTLAVAILGLGGIAVHDQRARVRAAKRAACMRRHPAGKDLR